MAVILYVSQWAHYKEIQYLIPLIGEKSKSRDTMGMKEKQEELKPSTSKKSIAERKLELLAQATKAIATSPQAPVEKPVSNFSKYVDEKLATFDKPTRMIAEKRINDLLFEIELNAYGVEQGLNSNES